MCAEYQDRTLVDLASRRIQVDDIWSFTYAKQKNVAMAKAAPDFAGDTWTWMAIDADTKLVMSWFVGGRDSEYAMGFMDDLPESGIGAGQRVQVNAAVLVGGVAQGWRDSAAGTAGNCLAAGGPGDGDAAEQLRGIVGCSRPGRPEIE